MKKTTVLKFSLLLMPFLLGFVHSEDPFEELNTSRSVESVQEFDQQITSSSSVNSRYVVIDKQFWNGNYSKLVEVESFEQSFPPGDLPTQTDFFIKFDDEVINSFSDHMVRSKVPIIHDMFYSLRGDKLRVTTLLRYSELNKLEALKGLMDLKGSEERKAKGDVAILGIDVTLKIFNQEDEANSVFLTFNDLRSYRFWRDGRDSKTSGDRLNEKIFLGYIKSGIGENERKNFRRDAEQLEKDQKALESVGNYKEAVVIANQLQSLQKKAELVSVVEDRFDTQISLRPKFIGTLIEFMKQSDVFNKYLNVTHYHILEGNGTEKRSIQAVKLSRLDKALQIALPDVEINYVAIKQGSMNLTGRVTR
tara:strand:+ start:163 stop:1254 length:1092 start_codon:yes stop_codon:yes gene_type:complete